MRGRYPAGLEECIDELEGTLEDKQRLQSILATVCGAARLFESCAALDVGETRFRQLRQQALQGALDGIKAKPPGRLLTSSSSSFSASRRWDIAGFAFAPRVYRYLSALRRLARSLPFLMNQAEEMVCPTVCGLISTGSGPAVVMILAVFSCCPWAKDHST